MIQPISNTMPPLVPTGFLSQTSYASQALPQNNAVKIDIHNPYASSQAAPCSPYMMPQASAYAPYPAGQQAYQMPVPAQYIPYMTAPMAQQIVTPNPVAQQIINHNPASQVYGAPMAQTVAPVMTQPVSAPVAQTVATPMPGLQAPSVATVAPKTVQTAPVMTQPAQVAPVAPQVVTAHPAEVQVAPQVAPVAPQVETAHPAEAQVAPQVAPVAPQVAQVAPQVVPTVTPQPVVVVPQPVTTHQPQIINAPQAPVVIPVPTPVIQSQTAEPLAVVSPAPVANVSVPEQVAPVANATVNIPAPQQVVTDTVQAQPQVEAPASTPVNFDLNQIISNLNSTNPDMQLAAIENVAETAQTTSPNAVQLLDTQIMEALAHIIKRDTSQMQAPTPEQLTLRQRLISGETLTPEQTAEASKLSEMEIAERNKQFALYTVAILQKLLSSEVEKAQGTKLEMKDLPMINDVVKIAKADTNPMIRASALAALSFIATPENKPLLAIMFEQSKKDADPNVQAVAEEALNKLSQI